MKYELWHLWPLLSQESFLPKSYQFKIERLKIDLDFELEEFDLGMSIAFKYWQGSKRSCFMVYRFLDNFLMQLLLTMRFPECYKDILSSFWCFENWTGPDAKIFDKCELSSDELIQIIEFEIQ